MGDEELTIRLTGERQVETVRNAIRAVESHEEVTVSRSRGRPSEGEITRGEAVTAIAAAYTGVDVGDLDG